MKNRSYLEPNVLDRAASNGDKRLVDTMNEIKQRINVLCVFESQTSMQRHIDTMLYCPPAAFNPRERKLTVGNMYVHYCVINSEEDKRRFIGSRFQYIELFYTPPESMLNFLKSLIRNPHFYSH